MFEVKLDGVDALALKLRQLSEKIAGLHQAIPDELVAWQREDMRRQFPNMTVETIGEETSASTEIWPRSRLPSTDQHRHQVPNQRGPRQYRAAAAAPVQHRIGGGRELASTRPILRAELLRRLRDRMLAVTKEATKWP